MTSAPEPSHDPKHDHVWTPDPEVSGRTMTRYSCPCGAWGFRVWPRRRGAKVPPIVPLKAFDRDAYLEEVAIREEADRNHMVERDDLETDPDMIRPRRSRNNLGVSWRVPR